MERLGWWLCAGLARWGVGSDGAARAEDAAEFERPQMFLGTLLRESSIVYPLVVGEWQAVGEHLFEDQEDGVSVRYAHGQDRDRWVDLYFYPAGALTPAQFVDAVRMEIELIRQAHLQAGHTAFDMGRQRSFRFPRDDGDVMEGETFDLGYAIDGVHYSSAMTLLLDRLYFVKARYSIEQSRLSRRDTREQLQAFVAELQPQLAIASVGEDAPELPSLAAAAAAAGMREIRLEYHAPDARPARAATAPAAELSTG